MNETDVFAAIIGGGAAGLAAGNFLSRAGVACAILERQSRVGRKLLSTGNGRCNFTNINAVPADYHSGLPAAVRAALTAFPPQEALAFFAGLGVIAAIDDAGRAYPYGNQAAGVLDALRLAAAENGCRIYADFAVETVARRGGGFLITAADGQTICAQTVLIATGGLAAPKLGAAGDGYRLLERLGARITPRTPALVPLKSPATALRALKGIRAQAALTLIIDDRAAQTEAGEVLFGEGSVSGIAAMQLGRAANIACAHSSACALKMDFLPPGTDALAFLEARCTSLPRRAAEELFGGVLPKRLAQTLIKDAGLALTQAANEFTPAERRALAKRLDGWTIPITGTPGFDAAQVTAGGADLTDFDPQTLECRRAPGLFAAGEVLDVDGGCGGYNLQWAWSSAYVTCREIIRRASGAGAEK